MLWHKYFTNGKMQITFLLNCWITKNKQHQHYSEWHARMGGVYGELPVYSNLCLQFIFWHYSSFFHWLSNTWKQYCSTHFVQLSSYILHLHVKWPTLCSFELQNHISLLQLVTPWHLITSHLSSSICSTTLEYLATRMTNWWSKQLANYQIF